MDTNIGDAAIALLRVSDPVAAASLTPPPSLAILALVTGGLVVVAYVLAELANYQEIRRNWSHYQCQPSITPFARYYGHDLKTTMSFCIGQSVKEYSPEVIQPIVNGIGDVARTVDGVYEKVDAVAGGVEELLTGFKNFVVEFVNSFRLVGVRVRMSVIRIQEIFQRVYGIFLAFAYAAISALTFGENIVCNPLVAFIADIAGVDVCCFAPDTPVRLLDDRRPVVSIDAVRVGDRLSDGGVVTTTLEFDGSRTPMVRIGDIHVSGNHRLLSTESNRWIRADAADAATKAPSIPRLFCLSTSTNRIPVGSLLFTDYEEASDAATVLAAQRAAERGLNGTATTEEAVDYGLGLDPSIELQCADGRWRLLSDIRIGQVLSTGAAVLGLVREQCDVICRLPSGQRVAAAQLVHRHGIWVRAHTVFAPLFESVLLFHVILDRNVEFIARDSDKRLYFLRDYAEWTPAQSVYDEKLSAGL